MSSTLQHGGQPGAGVAPQLTYAYLMSAPHSGSTLLACLLEAHPEITSVGELGSDFPLSQKCSCGVTYDACTFWRRCEAAARERGFDFRTGQLGLNLQPRRKWPIEDLFYYQFPLRIVNRARNLAFGLASPLPRRAAETIERSVQVARMLCEMQSTAIFLDTTKNPLQTRFLAGQRMAEPRFIGLVRDGRAVMCSLMNRYKFSRQRAVGAWLWCNRNMERAIAHYVRPDQVFRLRHEDLCAAPEPTLRAVLGFLGTRDRSPWHDRDPRERHVIGNLMRHGFSGKIELDERWRTALQADDLRYFERRAGALNRRYGYDG